MGGAPDDGNGTTVLVRVAWIGAVATIAAALIAVVPQIFPPEPTPPPPPTPKTTTTGEPAKFDIAPVDAQFPFTQVGARPVSLAADSGRIWVADPTRPEAWWVNADGAPKTHRVRLSDIERPAQAPIRPVGVAAANGAAWFVDERHDLLWRIDAESNVSATPSHVGRSPAGVAIDGQVVWVVSRKPGAVWRIDAGSGDRLGAPIDLSPGAPRAIVARGGVAWVVGSEGPRGAVWKISSGDSEPESTPGLDGAPVVAVAMADDAVWIANADGKVSRIDPDENVVETSTPLEGRPCGIAVGKEAVLVSDSEGDQVWRLDPKGGRPLERPVRVEAHPCAITLGTDAAWVGNLGDNSISRITP